MENGYSQCHNKRTNCVCFMPSVHQLISNVHEKTNSFFFLNCVTLKSHLMFLCLFMRSHSALPPICVHCLYLSPDEDVLFTSKQVLTSHWPIYVLFGRADTKAIWFVKLVIHCGLHHCSLPLNEPHHAGRQQGDDAFLSSEFSSCLLKATSFLREFAHW